MLAAQLISIVPHAPPDWIIVTIPEHLCTTFLLCALDFVYVVLSLSLAVCVYLYFRRLVWVVLCFNGSWVVQNHYTGLDLHLPLIAC